MTAPSERPVLRVVRGDATPEELAAVVALLTARAAAVPPPAAPVPRSAWGDPVRQLRAPLLPGPGVWRASALPR